MPLENSNFKTEIAALLARKDLAGLKEKLAASLSADIAPTVHFVPPRSTPITYGIRERYRALQPSLARGRTAH